MNKRGQLTLFIVIAIIVIALILFTFYIYSRPTVDTTRVTTLTAETEAVNNLVDFCIEETAKDALQFVGRRGGYFDLPKYSTEGYLINTAYYFYLNRELVPTKQRLESEVSNYMDEELFFCLQNFAALRDKDITVEQGIAQTRSTITKDAILFTVELPITIKKGNTQTSIRDFTNDLRGIEVGKTQDISKEIIATQKENPDSICLSCLTNLAIENDLQIEINRLDDNTLLFTIRDLNSLIETEPYELTFAYQQT